MRIFVAVNLLLLFSFSVCQASADNDAKIRTSYENFRLAMLSGDGVIASQYVSKDVLEYYNQARKLALKSDATDIEREPQIKVLMILQLRYLLSKKALSKMNNGQDVFTWGVKNSLINTDVINQFSLNEIQIKENSAFASILKNGAPVDGIGFNFKHERNNWKFDLIKLLSAPNVALDKVRQQAGKTRIELALYMMEENYGKPIPIEIMNGPLK